jgi:hypothetical protein
MSLPRGTVQPLVTGYKADHKRFMTFKGAVDFMLSHGVYNFACIRILTDGNWMLHLGGRTNATQLHMGANQAHIAITRELKSLDK